MKYKVCLLLAVVALTSASKDADEWESWKKDFNKTYNSEKEELYRQTVWISNKKYIEEHNAHADLWGYEVGLNEFADMDAAEFSKLIVGPSSMFGEEQQTANKVFVSSKSVEDLPKSVDWRKKGYVTRVKNQGRCVAGYAFSTTGSYEAQNFIKTGKLVPLSEQNIIDCSGIFHNKGCKGGTINIGLIYVITNHGVDTEKSYPYRSQDGVSYECQFNNKTIGATADTMTGTANPGNELELQKAVATIAPISVIIDAAHIGFQFYKRGVYHSYFCSSRWLNHAVLVVGYGVDHFKDYWLVKNSWGRSWGINGYIKMSRNRGNNCGIATIPRWPDAAPWP